MNINLIYTKLKPSQTAILHSNDDGTYTILVNSNKSENSQRNGILHEISHIKCNDFSSELHTSLLETMAHAREISDEFEDINFYCHII